MVRKKFPCVNWNLELWDMTLNQGHDMIVWYIIKILLGIKELWPAHSFGSWTTIVWNTIKVTLGSEELWPGQRFWVCVHCDLDLGDMTLGQGHDTWPWGKVMTHRWAMDNCEISSRSHLAVRSNSPDTDFGYMCTVTLTLEMWLCVKVMTHPWVMDNKCVKYYPDLTWLGGVMVQTQILNFFRYVCTETLEIWSWVKVKTHPWVMDNNCVKYHPGWTSV